MGCQRVGAGSGLQGELVWSRGEVKRSGPLSGERLGHKAAKHVACCYAPHAAVWLALCREACHCERRGDVCGDTCLRQLRGRFGKKLDGIDVLQQELQMLRPHAGKAGRSATSSGAQGGRYSPRAEVDWPGPAGESSSDGTSARGTGGRRVGSVSAAQVASLPGASSAAVSTWRALETSPL